MPLRPNPPTYTTPAVNIWKTRTNWSTILNQDGLNAFIQAVETELKRRHGPGNDSKIKFQHIQPPRDFPCLVKCHFFQVDEVKDANNKLLRATHKIYFHAVLYADLKNFFEVVMRSGQRPDPKYGTSGRL